VALKVIQGFSTAQANVGYGSMMADVCDEHEYETGRRQEGAFLLLWRSQLKRPAALARSLPAGL